MVILQMRLADAPVIRFLDRIIDFCEGFYTRYDPTLKDKGIAIYDSLVIAYLLRPSLFRTERLDVTVETEGRITRGQTVPDRRPFSENQPQMDVCLEVDKEALFDLYLEIITGSGYP